MNIAWVLVDFVLSYSALSEESCLQLEKHAITMLDSTTMCSRPKAEYLDVLDWSPRIVHWTIPWIQPHDAVNTLASQIGWVQDVLIMALLLSLIVLGAGLPLSKMQGH
jgi:hypothetical protein